MKISALVCALLLAGELHANPVSDDIRDFRIYPRLQKAHNYIAKHELGKAKSILKKVVAIDPNNSEALRMLVAVSLEQNDLDTAKRYVVNITSLPYQKFYTSRILYAAHDYGDAWKIAEALPIDAKLNEAERALQEEIAFKSAILSHQTDAVAKYLKERAAKAKPGTCLSDQAQTISLLLENGFFDLAKEEIARYDKNCHKDQAFDKNHLVWAEKLRDNGREQEAMQLIGLLPEGKTKDEENLTILLKQKAYPQAVSVMEKIWHKEPTQQNENRLIYLARQANMKEKLESLYDKSYARNNDPDTLRNLLYLYSDDANRFRILKKYAPFRGLKNEERYDWSLKLADLYKKAGEMQKAVKVLESTSQLPDLDQKELEAIAWRYTELDAPQKAITLYQKLYRTHASIKYYKRLLYLCKNTRGYAKTYKKLLLDAPAKCDREIMLALMNYKPKTAGIIRKIERYAPYRCLHDREKYLLLDMLYRYHRKHGEHEKSRKLLLQLSSLHSLTFTQMLNLAYRLADAGLMKRSTQMARKVVQKDPQNVKAYKLLAANALKRNDIDDAIDNDLKAYLLQPAPDTARELGELYYKKGDRQETLHYWDRYTKASHDSSYLLKSARVALEMHTPDRTKSYLERILTPPKGEESDYWYLRSVVSEHDGDDAGALEQAKKAAAYPDASVEIVSRLAMLQAKAHHIPEAVKAMRRALSMTHDPLQKAAMTAQIGYWYQAQKADAKAIEAFKEAVSLQKSAAYYKALGYSQMRLHQRVDAVTSFKNAINLMPASDLNQTALYEMKRNITYLQKRFFGYFAMIGGNQVKKSISPIADNKTGGFAALRLGYRPLTSTDRLEVYLDAAVGIRNNSFATNDESFQPGVGLAYRVTSDGHIVVSVTQLFKTGKRSRNDTMLRLSGKFFDDYTYHPDTAGRWYKSLYADLAYYLNYESYRLYAKYEQGYMFKPDQHTSLMPYAMTSVAYNNDNKAKKTMYNYDAGVGLSYLFWLGETRYTMPAYTGRVGLEARKSYNTNYDKDTELDMMIELLF